MRPIRTMQNSPADYEALHVTELPSADVAQPPRASVDSSEIEQEEETDAAQFPLLAESGVVPVMNHAQCDWGGKLRVRSYQQPRALGPCLCACDSVQPALVAY